MVKYICFSENSRACEERPHGCSGVCYFAPCEHTPRSYSKPWLISCNCSGGRYTFRNLTNTSPYLRREEPYYLLSHGKYMPAKKAPVLCYGNGGCRGNPGYSSVTCKTHSKDNCLLQCWSYRRGKRGREQCARLERKPEASTEAVCCSSPVVWCPGYVVI